MKCFLKVLYMNPHFLGHFALRELLRKPGILDTGAQLLGAGYFHDSTNW